MRKTEHELRTMREENLFLSKELAKLFQKGFPIAED